MNKQIYSFDKFISECHIFTRVTFNTLILLGIK